MLGEPLTKFWLMFLLIGKSKFINKKEQASGGWRGLRHFKVKHKVKQSEVITSFELEPEDGQAVTPTVQANI